MTATATITTVERSDVLLVPNAALRYTPASAAAAAPTAGNSIVSSMMPRPPAQRQQAPRRHRHRAGAPGLGAATAASRAPCR